MILLKTLVAAMVLWLLALAVRHWRDRSPGPYVEPRFPSPIDKPRCRVCAGAARPAERDGPGGISAQAASALAANPSSGTSRARVGQPETPSPAAADTEERTARPHERASAAPDERAAVDPDETANGARDAASAARTTPDDRSAADARGSADRLVRDAPSEPTAAPATTRPQPSDGRGGTLFVAPGRRDDLKKIKGIGKVMEGKLNALGITTFEQLAGFEQEDIERVDATLESFQGRIERDRWVEQAAKLARGEEGS